jgi:hypothetical protein
MNITNHISERLETIFGLKILKFFGTDPEQGTGIRNLIDPGSGMEQIRIRDEHPGSATVTLHFWSPKP